MVKIGDIIGKLTVLEYSKVYKMFLCKCDCGNMVWLPYHVLKPNKNLLNSCGCVKKKYNRMYQHEGVDGTIEELCEYFGISYLSTKNKMSHGWNFQDCIDMPTRLVGKLYDLNGWKASVSMFAKKYGVQDRTLRRNLKRTNDSIEEALELSLNNNLKEYQYGGRCGTAHKIAFYNGMNPSVVYRRLNLGWTIKEAIETPIRTYDDLTGKRFGNLTVVKRAYLKNGLGGWLCQCDCGSTTKAIHNDLVSGRKKSCGCMKGNRTNVIQGERFGMLTVIEDTGIRNNSGRPIIKCRCDCGNECFADYSHLKRGAKKSCGCLRNRNKPTSDN